MTSVKRLALGNAHASTSASTVVPDASSSTTAPLSLRDATTPEPESSGPIFSHGSRWLVPVSPRKHMQDGYTLPPRFPRADGDILIPPPAAFGSNATVYPPDVIKVLTAPSLDWNALLAQVIDPEHLMIYFPPSVGSFASITSVMEAWDRGYVKDGIRGAPVGLVEDLFGSSKRVGSLIRPAWRPVSPSPITR